MTRTLLNPAQLNAVRTRRGPLLVLAGAGTGKTRVITYRISELIRSGIAPERILAVTFTNKAAREMKQRAMELLGKRRGKGQKGPEISTFHALCVRILRRHIDRLGYPKQFAIYDQGDQDGLARAALRDLRVGQERLRPGDLLAIIGSWKSRSVRPEQAEQLAQSEKEQLAALAYARYQDGLRASGAVDFDDLLLCTEELFDRFQAVRREEAGRFDHLLIDEYQDTNGLQYRIVRALAERHRNLCVVGDDDQSIYGWRGAEVSHILGFTKDWPGAKVVRLEDNYRSRGAILELSNTLIAHNATRHDKVLRASRTGGEPPRTLRFENETSEATEIVRTIRERVTAEGPDRVPASHFAILFRTNEQPRAFEQELRREKVPYVLVGGQSFYDRKEVRDVLAYLKVLAHPSDEISLLRIINTPRRGISTGVVQTLVQAAVEEGCPLWNILPRAINSGDISHHAGERVEQFRLMMEAYRDRLGSEPLVAVVRSLLERIDYKSELARTYKNPGDAASRWESVGELLNSLGAYEARAKNASLREFLEEASLGGREDLKDEDKPRPHAVTLMTLHSAKGLEFPHVFMVGMEEGLLPHKRSVADAGNEAIAEERRLCYVGITRAQDTLTLSFCKTRMKWGVARAQIPSRFLMEMKGETEKARRAAEAAAERLAAEQEGPQKAGRGMGKTSKTGKRTPRPIGSPASRESRPRARGEVTVSSPDAPQALPASAPGNAGAPPPALHQTVEEPAVADTDSDPPNRRPRQRAKARRAIPVGSAAPAAATPPPKKKAPARPARARSARNSKRAASTQASEKSRQRRR